MMKYREIYEFGCETLKAAEISDYNIDASLLLQFVFGTDRNFLYLHGEDEATEEKLADYKSLISKRASHIPVQHLTNNQNFMGFDFFVNENVLIPRLDTEILVECVLKELHDGMKIIDMCTGSGCILLSLLKLSNDCEGLGVDISDKALEVFSINKDRLNVPDASCIKSDLFENVEGTFDILVSNPPYIRSAVIPSLMEEVKDHDPLLALDGHESGLYFYEKIISEAENYLKRGSYVFFEIGDDQGEAVSNLLKDANYLDVSIIKDLCGLDRVVKGVHR